MFGLVFLIVVICVVVYVKKRKEEREMQQIQEERASKQEKSTKWKTHPVFEKALSDCKYLVDTRIERAKAQTYNVGADGVERIDKVTIACNAYGLCDLRISIDTNTYNPLTEEQKITLMMALYDALKAHYRSVPGVAIKYCSDPARVEFDITGVHPKRYLKDIGI